MNIEKLFTPQDAETLQTARETYGPFRQIGVAAEECTELAKELIKAFRFDDFSTAVEKTKENVVDEVADVLIILDHVIKLYNITAQDISPHIEQKMTRLRYWLEHDDRMEFTTEYRNLGADDEGETFEKYQKELYESYRAMESGEDK